jgi:hypothetical protein
MKTITRFTSSFAVLACLAVPAAASADALPGPVTGMDCIVGTWQGGGTITMGKDTARIGTSWSCNRVSQQWGVVCTFRVAGIPGVALYEETDLMGYDPETNTYHWYAVTNAGETHDHVARVPTGNFIEFTYTGTQDGKPFKEVIAMTFGADAKTVTGRAESFVAGASTSVMQIAMHK